jgi:tetratricopeptide (TPR) repeat protein
MAIEINPEDSYAYKNRGIAYYAIKEYDKAWADVHKAEKLGNSVEPRLLELLEEALKKS